ncbi:glycosyltransferase [Terribacillus saccharophilus]|uniref:glycosyltransferase n=1 Tax=Terribacillus saccharophilus TaxID=361277 RepID=UPI002989F9E4|nr:glycosyltransferase [Terribacillus saccharophilus]MCM3225243.1 glycosyltransferase family 4 protein [Terribacillus saccharophilus]
MKVLYITPFVPHKNIDHAGGYFLYKYLKNMSEQIQVSVLSVENEQNLFAKSNESDWLDINLVRSKKQKDNKFTKIYNAYFNPLDMPSWQIKALKNKIVTDSEFFNSFDIIEVHFSQLLPLARVLKQHTNRPLVSFEHDVYFESVIRRVEQASFSNEKIIRILQNFKVKRIETGILNMTDYVFAFSKKDIDTLSSAGVTTLKSYLSPAIEIPNQISDTSNENKNITFVGAMQRPENYEAAIWFLEEVWDEIVKSDSNVKFYVVGANPPKKLLNYASENVIITGFVEDLDEYYKEASIIVAPLLTGAGVKFKVVQALSYGLPVVTTPVGAEGIVNENNTSVFAEISFDKEKIKTKILALLQDKELRRYYGENSRKWIEDNYNFEKNTISKAIDIYSSIKEKGMKL